MSRPAQIKVAVSNKIDSEPTASHALPSNVIDNQCSQVGCSQVTIFTFQSNVAFQGSGPNMNQDMNQDMNQARARETSSRDTSCKIKVCQIAVTLLLVVLPGLAEAQFVKEPADSSKATVSPLLDTTKPRPIPTYERPSAKTRVNNYFFDVAGPYPLVGAAIGAGINQVNNSPPEWKQGAAGYAKRFGSDFGIASVATTTRYGLAEVLHEDTLYYRCECRGLLPRLRHAVTSTFTARTGEDGHRVFSVPALVAPYAGTMTAVYGWYPRRYDARDAFRMGNYSLLGYIGGNIALEFLHSGSHSWLSRMRLNNRHAAASPSGANP